jgi:3-methyladenine DNA glycosylase AlkD
MPITVRSPRHLTVFVAARFRELADPAKAAPMAAYMRTSQPFYGVQRAGLDALAREVFAQFPCIDRATYERNTLALWKLRHREERYLAIRWARQKKWVGPESLPLYEQLIREGAWWDFVDEIASHLVGSALGKARPQVEPVLDRWIADPDLWIRRAAVLAQLRLGKNTDPQQLFRYILRLAPESEFFLRKAVGWALREYSKTAPETVAAFLRENRAQLSPLSLREGAKHLIRSGELASDFGRERR